MFVHVEVRGQFVGIFPPFQSVRAGQEGDSVHTHMGGLRQQVQSPQQPAGLPVRISKQWHSVFPWAKFGKKHARTLTIVSMTLNS